MKTAPISPKIYNFKKILIPILTPCKKITIITFNPYTEYALTENSHNIHQINRLISNLEVGHRITGYK